MAPRESHQVVPSHLRSLLILLTKGKVVKRTMLQAGPLLEDKPLRYKNNSLHLLKNRKR